MIEPAFIIQHGTEVYKAADRYTKLVDKGPPKYFTNDEKVALYESEVALAESEFWTLIEEHISHNQFKGYEGEWVLRRVGKNYMIVRKS